MSSEVSVLIPAHGASPYVNFTLESIVNNSIQPDEVLIIDDGLSSEALTQIDKFTQVLPISILSNKGKGLVDALNTGLEAAEGKYIARIDNDDLMLGNRIGKQLEQFENDRTLVAVGSQCIYINSKGTITGKSNYPEGVINNLPDFKFRCLIAHPSTMYLRSSALTIGGYRSIFTWNGVDIAEDFDFWLRLSGQGIISVSGEYLTKYRQHTGQISSRHLAGQMIGTPYVSAVNIAAEKNSITVRFNNGKSSELSLLLDKVKNKLGFKKYLACRLSLLGFQENYLISNSIAQRIISKITSML